MATLDVTGILVSLAAAAVLTLNDEADRRWWWAVGLASVLAVLTTVVLIRIEDQRRNFMKAAEQKAAEQKAVQEAAGQRAARMAASQKAAREAAQQKAAQKAADEADQRFYQDFLRLLNDLADFEGPLPEGLREWALKRRDLAEERGYFHLADQLTINLARRPQS